MRYKKAALRSFAKDCAFGSKALMDGLCMSEEVVKSEIGKILVHSFDVDRDEILLGVAKCFAKIVNDRMVPDVNTGETQEFCDLIFKLVEICEENIWFEG